MAEGFWRQHELWDGTYTVRDLLDIHELIAVRSENAARARNAHKDGGNVYGENA